MLRPECMFPVILFTPALPQSIYLVGSDFVPLQ